MADGIDALAARIRALTQRIEKASAAHTPPEGVRSAAARGLALRQKWKRGGLSNKEASDQGIGSGVQRAVNLKNGDAISIGTVKQMHAFFSRHAKNYAPEKKETDGGPTAGTIAWLLWGGNAGRDWAAGIVSRVEKMSPSPSSVHVPSADWSGGEKLAPGIEDALESRAALHNSRVKPARKVSVETLRRVYRRGQKRYDPAIEKSATKGAYALARVTSFLRLARLGRPDDPAYNADNDLLPEGHPRAVAKARMDDVAARLDALSGRLEKARERWPAGSANGMGGKFKPKEGGAGGAGGKPLKRSDNPASEKMAGVFAGARVGPENTNAKPHNARIDALEKAFASGDVKAIITMSFGTNTYAKRQVKVANQALEALGSEHRVAPGQKANTHPGLTAPAGGKAPDVPKPAPAPAPSPAPAPDKPKAPAYKEAKTIAEAKAQLEAFGMTVVPLAKMSQSDYNKQKIASAPPEKKALYEKWYGPKKTKRWMTDENFLGLLNAIGPEAARLSVEHPSLLRVVHLEQRFTGPKALGEYWPLHHKVRMRAPAGLGVGTNGKTLESMAGNPLKEGEVPWTVQSGPTIRDAIGDTFRHEAGHAIDFRYGRALSYAIVGSANDNNIKLTKYMKASISTYGGKNNAEAVAELVALYTSANYKRGTIAPPIEKALDIYFEFANEKARAKIAGSVTKALEDTMKDVRKAALNEVDDIGEVSVSIPPPPPGYELIKADGIDIQFRAPDGGIVTYMDLVETGFYGSEDE